MIKNAVHRLGVEIKRYTPNPVEEAVITIEKPSSKGEVLLSYIVEPYLHKPQGKVFNTHTHYWESDKIANIFLEMGYALDIIDYRNKKFNPQKKYSIFVGARTNFERLAKALNNDCIKIVHLDTSHWTFNNYAAYSRLRNLFERRGFSLKGSLRLIEENLGIEYADFATLLGNDFTMHTYRFAKKPLYKIPISTCGIYPWDDNKDFAHCSHNYLWFASAGAVHRGLDLLLEAFCTMPDYHLYICGPVQDESDFLAAYNKELYEKENIHLIGWQDVNNPEFLDICRKCIALLYPSCAEGQSGAVINCMHAGLIPIISRESGVDVGNFGIIFNECSIEEIKKIIRTVSDLPPQILSQRAKKTWEFARENHTREKFAREYKAAIEEILSAGTKIKNL